ncbi:hypothetical protein ACNQFZ_06735 [Schinkia sp. CFF1]
MIDLSGVSIPFSANDLLQTAISLIMIIASFVLLTSVIRLAPSLISFIKSAVLVEKNRRNINKRYFRDDPLSFRDSFKDGAKNWWSNR